MAESHFLSNFQKFFEIHVTSMVIDLGKGQIIKEEGLIPCSKSEATKQPRKLSDIMKEMLERLFRNPDVAHSAEALHVALFFANVAWNECVGLDHDRQALPQCVGDHRGRKS